MKVYIVNENTTEQVAIKLRNVVSGEMSIEIEVWPASIDKLPADLEAGILIISSENSKLESNRVLAVINAGKRLICVQLDEIPDPSELIQKYCSVKVSGNLDSLIGGLMGDDNIQEEFDGTPSGKNPQKPHNC